MSHNNDQLLAILNPKTLIQITRKKTSSENMKQKQFIQQTRNFDRQTQFPVNKIRKDLLKWFLLKIDVKHQLSSYARIRSCHSGATKVSYEIEAKLPGIKFLQLLDSYPSARAGYKLLAIDEKYIGLDLMLMKLDTGLRCWIITSVK